MDELDLTPYERFLAQRRAEIMAMISEAAERAGRGAGEVRAIAVSKTVGPEEVLAARRVGWQTFGENRPQELSRKLEAIGRSGEPPVSFHMIGNLQKNKINQVIGRVELIHSVSSAHLAEAISKRSEARGLRCACLLEVNVSGEQSKSGFDPDDLRAQAEGVIALPGIEVRGLMTMAPAGDADAARRTFSGLRELADELRSRTGLPLEELSCGMSDDFDIAVEEGSTLVRLGRCVFNQSYVMN